jgi:hypothetical protein
MTEPDFRSDIVLLLEAVSKQLKYLPAEFDPRFTNQISAEAMSKPSGLRQTKSGSK